MRASPLKQSGWDGTGCLKSPLGPLEVCVPMSRGDTSVSGNLVVEGSRGPAPCVCGHVSGQVCEYLLTLLLYERVLGGVGACFLLGVSVQVSVRELDWGRGGLPCLASIASPP